MALVVQPMVGAIDYIAMVGDRIRMAEKRQT
jgi:hypothetical protein